MITTCTIQIVNSWMITGQGIIAELKLENTGLAKGTILESKHTGKRWTIKSRIIFNHAADKQKTFPNETESFMHLSFATIENLKKSVMDIVEKEKTGIFQYHLDPCEHNDKPTPQEELSINK